MTFGEFTTIDAAVRSFREVRPVLNRLFKNAERSVDIGSWRRVSIIEVSWTLHICGEIFLRIVT